MECYGYMKQNVDTWVYPLTWYCNYHDNQASPPSEAWWYFHIKALGLRCGYIYIVHSSVREYDLINQRSFFSSSCDVSVPACLAYMGLVSCCIMSSTLNEPIVAGSPTMEAAWLLFLLAVGASGLHTQHSFHHQSGVKPSYCCPPTKKV